MNSSPYLSIILPVHNEEHRLPSALEKLNDFFSTQTYAVEIIIVENGSTDHTYETAVGYRDRMQNLIVMRENKRGKGIGVRRGMLEARGEYRFFCDVDFSMPVQEINRFFPPQLTGIDISIASREFPGAIRYNEPEYRHIIGRIFNTMVRIAALPGLQDTQCGFKCFSARAALDIFSRVTLTGMTFDVEALLIGKILGYRIVEIPVPWYFNPDSRVRLVQDSLRMAYDLIQIQKNRRLGLYK